ncbi:MAG TPA: tRNA (N6-isopentenyl adenosine(37)-C2)-methylthiotransferase MiaB [Candidatus Dormibacteraeota bacterium]|jgi:tRNA-2-methylthio-N6-dimethylallyladenosine synthase|nr:tRNA (N6-isopentenyl adenosine(37)-C2)-methylthiotransferase MiaB [Candidatus Dormibacteraeota bacterium]
MEKAFHIGLESLAGGKSPAQAETDIFFGAPKRGTFYLETFGCQMNEHDSEKVAGVLLSRGYQQVDSIEAASFVLYNTCSIREKAAQKVFSRLGEFRDMPGEPKKIGVLGCVAQQEGEKIFHRSPWVNLVCGSASYSKLPELLAQLEAGEKRVTGLDTDTDETFETELTRRDNPWRAYLTIIEGCDKACSYCVVPFTRGPERSRASDSVLRELRQLTALGYTEVQFLGQTVNSYRDPSPRNMKFSELLHAAAEMPGMRRVRFTTSHPRDFGPDIVATIENDERICNHVHLPVQSGSARVLRAMQRTYSRTEYLEKIAMMRGAKRLIAVTSDIIVGFPGETESEFEETLSLLEEVKYEAIFAFKYSPRPNTPAQTMDDAIPEEEKSRRLAVLLELQRKIQNEANEKLIGQNFEVHVEGKSKKEKQWSGHTSCHRVVNFLSEQPNLLGTYVPVNVEGATPNCLIGKHKT